MKKTDLEKVKINEHIADLAKQQGIVKNTNYRIYSVGDIIVKKTKANQVVVLEVIKTTST